MAAWYLVPKFLETPAYKVVEKDRNIEVRYDDVNGAIRRLKKVLERMDFQKELFTGDYNTFNEELIRGDKARSNGVSAMSVSDMTGIPRATVIRKCKFLLKNDYLRLNEKKQYILTDITTEKILPYQKSIFKNKAKFIRKVLNLLTIS